MICLLPELLWAKFSLFLFYFHFCLFQINHHWQSLCSVLPLYWADTIGTQKRWCNSLDSDIVLISPEELECNFCLLILFLLFKEKLHTIGISDCATLVRKSFLNLSQMLPYWHCLSLSSEHNFNPTGRLVLTLLQSVSQTSSSTTLQTHEQDSLTSSHPPPVLSRYIQERIHSFQHGL